MNIFQDLSRKRRILLITKNEQQRTGVDKRLCYALSKSSLTAEPQMCLE